VGLNDAVARSVESMDGRGVPHATWGAWTVDRFHFEAFVGA
jgi:hypothetical protein